MMGKKDNWIIDQERIGLDSNILVDLVISEEFKNEIKSELEFNVNKIYSTNISLGEARNVLIRENDYTHDRATKSLQNVIEEYNIEKIRHNREANLLAQKWVNKIKKKMFIKKFKTFYDDCKILANLYQQVNINIFYTQDKDLVKAIKILKIKVKSRLVGNASFISGFKIKEFFKGNRSSSRRFRRRHRDHH